jgi:hypothetical protein
MKYLKVKGGSPGQFSITASASGIPSSKIAFTVLDTKPSTLNVISMKPVMNYDFPILIQMCKTGGNPSVTSDIVRVNLVVSNASNIEVPSSIVLQGDRTEMLFYGRALTSKATTLTVSSSGFKSTSIQLTPSETAIKIQLKVGGKMPMNKPTEISLLLTTAGTPIQGAVVNWSGTGLTSPSSITDSSGIAKNGFTLVEPETQLEAMVKVGGGYLRTSKTIVAVPNVYHLEVSSNVPISTEGSGSYSYGDTITLEVPATAPMPHILGLLGGKYVFSQWIGAAPSTSNVVTLTIDGVMTEITQEALYSSDYVTMIIAVALIIVAILVAFFFTRRMKKKKAAEKPKETKPANPIVKPSPIRHN